MCRQPPKQSVQAALSATIPSHVKVDSLRPIASLRPQRIFEVSLSDGKTLLLSLPPQVLFRRLRHEQFIIGFEAAAVQWIRDALARNHLTSFTSPTLRRFIPTLVHTSFHGPVELGSAYNVFENQHGIPVALLPSPLSHLERKHLDKHLGQLYRSLSSMTSPSGRFGPVAVVVPKMPGIELSDKVVGLGEGGLVAADGARNWSTAFQSLLEGVLRDGEDMAVTMAYSQIRRHFRRFEHLLNEVKTPKLVVIDVADDTNTLVTVESTTSTNGYSNYTTAPQPASSASDNYIGTERRLTFTGLQDWSSCVFGDPLLATIFSDGVSESFMEGFETGPASTHANHLGGSSRNTSASTHSTSTGVMSITAITEQTTTTRAPAPTISSLPPPTDASSNSDNDIISSLIEDLPNAGIRLLLYQVYHAVLCIVKEFYRPRSSPSPSTTTCSSPPSPSSFSSSPSTNRELEARRKLTEALNRLESAAVPVVTPISMLSVPVPSSLKKQNLLASNSCSSPVAGARSLLFGVQETTIGSSSSSRSRDDVLANKKLHHRPSGDLSPAKRAKSASDGERG